MSTPPKFVTRLVERLTNSRQSEIILGDMFEEYNEQLKANGKLRADIHYLFDFITLLTNKVLKKPAKQRSNFFTMLANYLKIAFRQLGRQKLHNTINIAGLAIGLAVSFVIGLYVSQELSYDRFHEKAERIYLVPMTWKFATTQLPTGNTTSAAGPVMKEMFEKEVEKYVRMEHANLIFEGAQGPIVEASIEAVDSTFFDVFTFPLIAGNPKEALKEPYSIILTERAAIKYFGEDWKKKDLMSQTLIEQSGRGYKITGIVNDPPQLSHLPFDVLISITSLSPAEWEPSWDKASLRTYVLLEPNSSPSAIVADIPNRITAKYSKDLNDHVDLDLIPLRDVYLRSGKYSDFHNGDIRYVYVFLAIALLVLTIAIINYMNLSTARSLERAREVGVRKVVGAVRRELFWQFISESLLVTFAAVLFSIGIAYLLLPVFNNLSAKSVTMDVDQHPGYLGILIGIWLIISFLGGAYPAAVLSSFQPVKVLKGKFGSVGSGAILRKSLVVFQFAISILLIVCTLTINSQLSYMVNKKIGIDKERLIAIQLDSLSMANISTIRNEFASIVGVERSAMVSSSGINNGAKTTIYGGDAGDKQLLIFNLGADPFFPKTAGLEIIAGSDLSPEVPKDGTWEYLINESAVEFFGWTNETAIGKRFNLWMQDGVVKGVIRDYHFLPLQRPIEPLLIHAGKGNQGGYLSKLMIRVDNDNFTGITAAMEERWQKVVADSPLNFMFIDDIYRNMLYRRETRLSHIMNVFSTLAILIAGLGLFGLASYTIMQRTKELGIRKVLGASLSKLLIIVSGSFLTLIVVAFIIAAPISWYVMTNWLGNFAYPVGFNWMIVIAAGLLATLVAAGTVVYHAFEAARVNPATTLRSE